MTVRVSADFGPISEYLDIASATARVLESRHTRDQVTLALGLSASSHFGIYMDERAAADPERLHHVYEWHQLGEWSGRLWDMILTGSQSRVLTYNWRASNVPVPVGPDVSGVSNDERNEVHIFDWKAPLMEEGATVRIIPLNRVLAFPAGGAMRFTPHSVTADLTGPQTGAFQEEWLGFFSTLAGQVVDNEFILPLERTIDKEIGGNIINSISRSSPDGVTINTKSRKDHSRKVDSILNGFFGGMVRFARLRRGR